MLRTVGTTMVLLLIAMAAVASVSPVADPVEKALIGTEEVIIPANAPGFTPRPSELDEIIGDTLIVGTSFWDAQHNGGTSRSIGAYHSDAEPDWVFFQWTKLYTEAQGGARHVPYAIITLNDDGTMTLENGNDIDAGAERSGYNTLAWDATNGVQYPTMHTNPAGGGADFESYAYLENQFIPGFYQGFGVPQVFTRPHIWPHSVYGPGGYVHMVSHDQRDDNVAPMEISYMRYQDNGTGVLSPATGDGNPFLITDDAMNIAGTVTTNLTGEKVAIAMSVSRLETLGEEMDPEGSQFNNDIYVFMSEDYGETFDLDNPIDITQFIGPDLDLLPDTTAANRDTLRAYTDCCVIFDDEDRMLTAFTTQEMDLLRNSGFVMSHIYVHQKDANGDDWYSRINYQKFNGVTTEAWGRSTDRPSLTYDMDTGILWAVFREINGLNSVGDTTDYGAGFFGNGEVMVAASPPGEYNGLLWTEPVNITNTIWEDVGPAPAGSCQSETDPNVALRSEGDYLHIHYLLDLDAGTGIGEGAENTVTNNPVIYHRVAKQELIDIFEATAMWQHNYPMHVDSTGFFQDPGNYEWAEWGGFFTQDDRGGASVGEGSSLSPDEFELKQNYPNPFNPSTNIEFSLARPAKVKLAVYDVLGREVATLVNRGMESGSHSVVFFGDELPSGVYFYTLTAGGAEKTQKMVLMK